MKKNLLFAAFALSLAATLGSLFLSEVLKWTPCVLCWYQRIMLYPLIIILGVATVKEVTNLKYIVLTMTGIGALIAFYHTLLQFHVIPEKLSPCVAGVSCITPYYIGFSFINIPLLSLLTFLAISALMVAYNKSHE
ncbi:MAG: disulfide bond formation protein B [Candidatus Doudnabacteria bacterium]|nr:disulfide bond formation protein B [Candidatus Doudnabacteria bacterium]